MKKEIILTQAAVLALLATVTPIKVDAAPAYHYKPQFTAWDALRKETPVTRNGYKVYSVEHDAQVGGRTVRYLMARVQGKGQDYFVTCAADVTFGKSGRKMDCNADGYYPNADDTPAIDSKVDGYWKGYVNNGTPKIEPENIKFWRVITKKYKRRTAPRAYEKKRQGQEYRHFARRINYLARLKRRR